MITRNKRSRKILKQSQNQKYTPKHYDLKTIKGLRSKNPYKFCVPNIWNHFTNQSIEELLKDQPLDIVVSSSNSFTGNTIIQETMTYQQFRNYNGQLTLYLAQIQLDIQCPSFLNNEGKVFLWCSKGFTDSGWHYDSFENYLGVVEGVKIVYLKKKCSDWSKFESIWSDQYNHLKKGQTMNSKFVVLRENEMLYIPQGMLHRVISYDNTIGINVWMEGIEQQKIKGTHYHLRYVLNELVQNEMQQILLAQSKKNLEKINTKQYSIDIQTGFSKLNSFQSLHRSKQMKPLNQLIGIYICLLANGESYYMVQFICKLSQIIKLDSLIELPQTYQTIIALKLDEFAEKCQNIQEREEFFEFIQKHSEFLNSLKNSEIQLKKQIANMIVSSHLNL